MKKKIVSLCLVIALLATAITGATLAYFTDADKDVNVMTTGNVKIVQNETDRYGDPWNVDVVDGEEKEVTPTLLPAVYLKPDAEGNMVPYNPTTSTEGPGGYGPQTVDGKEMWYTGTMNNTDGDGVLKIYDGNINGEVDKVISVTNGSTMDVWVRTIVLMENDAENNILGKVHMRANYGKNGDTNLTWPIDCPDLINVGGTNYSVAVFTYKEALAAGATSSPSLMQLFLNPKTDNTWYDLVDGEFNIIAISQAVQKEGFDTAEQALDTAFGAVNTENVTDWLADENLVIRTDGLSNDIAGGNAWLEADKAEP